MGAEIKVEEGESIESALRRFRRECQKEGVLSEIRKREYYEKPSERRKRKEAQRKRRRRRQPT